MTRTNRRLCSAISCMGLMLASTYAVAQTRWVTYDGFSGPGQGKHIVLISGDEEYRSEETIPMLGKILAARHGFKCTVLFAINKETGEIDPDTTDNIPGLRHLRNADLMVIFTRFRNLPPRQMKHVEAYIQAGKPIVGLRTSTHAFRYADKDHPYAKWDFKSKVRGYTDGFGRQILGETWIAHHGHHGRESTRGTIAKGMENHPIVRGCEDIWGPTDVYRVRLPLPGDSKPLVMGHVLEGMKPTDKPVLGEKNDPIMPVAWTKTYRGKDSAQGRVFTTTMGASQDFESEGFRRLMVNACYWALGMEDRIAQRANVDLVGPFETLPFRFGGFQRGLKPEDHRIKL